MISSKLLHFVERSNGRNRNKAFFVSPHCIQKKFVSRQILVTKVVFNLSNDLLIQLIDWNNNTIGLNRILAVILIAILAAISLVVKIIIRRR